MVVGWSGSRQGESVLVINQRRPMTEPVFTLKQRACFILAEDDVMTKVLVNLCTHFFNYLGTKTIRDRFQQQVEHTKE